MLYTKIPRYEDKGSGISGGIERAKAQPVALLTLQLG